MKILVLGSGVIGVTSAWYLARAGHDVTLVDRQPQPAMETSFANGGQVSWGAANPWAAPGIPGKALGWLFKRHAPLVLRPRLDPAMWRWLGQMLRNCTDARYLANKERQLRLAHYSHGCLTELRNETGLHYDQSTHGLLIREGPPPCKASPDWQWIVCTGYRSRRHRPKYRRFSPS